jgi:transcriptional regulator with XRE-family HTH domain
MHIGEKIKRLRLRLGLTQEELADRAELSKGFISQVERDLTSPSIATLTDILECLGTGLKDFFNEGENEKIVFREEDMFVKENTETGEHIVWLIPSAQKNRLEPILLTLSPGFATYVDDPHEGEEFGYVLNGLIHLYIGEERHKLKKGESFCFNADKPHYIENKSKLPAKVLWISTPPSF